MNNVKQIIADFLDNFCTIVPENEDSATTELYMDDHDCIEYDDVLYYVPKNNSFYTEDDDLLRSMLVKTYQYE